MKSSPPSAFKRFCAALVAFALTLQPLGTYAAVITTSPLSEIPVQGANVVKPNIMYTLDDSSSMSWDFLPDYVLPDQVNGIGKFCRTGSTAGYCGVSNDASVPDDPTPQIMSSNFNKIYYDPAIDYSVGVRGDTAAPTLMPCEGSNTACDGPWTNVYQDGFAGYPGSNTGATTNLLTGYPDVVYCWKATTDPADYATAKTDGSVCRYNGVAYPSRTSSGVTSAAVAAGYNYPNSGTESCDTSTNKCVFGDAMYCRRPTTDPNDWATARSDGFVCRYNGVAYPSVSRLDNGTPVTTAAVGAGYNYPNQASFSGSCSFFGPKCEFSNLAVPYRYSVQGNPYYYTITSVQFCTAIDANGWGTGTCSQHWLPTNPNVSYGASGFDPTAFRRVDIVPTTPVYPSGRSYADEMTNFAKWYAFSRTRILAMKTAGGLAFSVLDSSSRVGLNPINSYLTTFLNIKDFTPANKSAWFTDFYTIVPSGSTPTISAMVQVGQYFSNMDTALPGDNIFIRPRAALPGATDPVDPVTGSCQPNYHLLATDGFWNQQIQNGVVVQTYPTGVAGPIGDEDTGNVPPLPAPVAGLTAGQPFPPQYQEDPQNPTSKVMADVAMYYWIHDLRPELANNVQQGTAPWQNVTFYGLSIGAEGTVPYPTGINDIILGTTPWPSPLAILTPQTTDDLWHATVNGHGKYYNVQNAQQLAEAIAGAIADFTKSQAGTATAVGLTGAQLSAGNSFAYKTSYEAGWWGDVRKYALDPATGALPLDNQGNPLNPPIWSAAPQLDLQAAGTGWDTSRIIMTINDSSNAAVPFRAGNLSTAQQSSLVGGWQTARPPTAQAVVNFLRGDQSNEGVGLTNFRVRSHVLGDIIGSAAVPVGAPSQSYTDPGYVDFVAAKQSRTPMVYVGANDGMLHAFDNSNTAAAGRETWAYIPKALFSSGDPNDSTHAPDPDFQLGALAYRRGGIPLFKHKNYVNATPRVWDVDFNNTNTSTPPQSGNDWHTMLVGGLGAGGRAVYALDVTNPVTTNDTEASVTASRRVLWEFNDPDGSLGLGYVFDAPTLVKTQRYGWVVLVASGYNNPGGKGALFVLNPKDGTLLKKIQTPVGSDSDPSGLSTIRAFTTSRKNPYVLQAYGGDLKGNVWRFDLSDPDDSKWKVELIATLADTSGHPQPITTGVRVEIDQNNNIDRYLFVGTGKMLDSSDLTNASAPTNTLYVIRDGTATAAEPAPATPYTRANLNQVDISSIAGFTDASKGRGWYMDAADAKQNIVTDVTADVQTVVAVFSEPSADPCASSLDSTLVARDYATGSSVLEASESTVVPSIGDIGAIAGVQLIQSVGSASSSGSVRALVTTMKGQVYSFGVKLSGTTTLAHRVSWRLINRD